MAALLAALVLATPPHAQELTRRFGPEEAPREMLLRSTTDLAVFGPVIEAFRTAHPQIAVTYEQWGSNDLYQLARIGCGANGAGTPPADLLISSAVHQMVDLVNTGCAAAYRSAHTLALDPALRWRDELWGVTREPAVMVYNRDQVPPAEVPASRFDLLDLIRPEASRYRGRVATYDIERSGLGFLLAFSDSAEASTFGGLMEAFGRSGAIATCCSAEIIDAVAEGTYLLAYNVLGSYAQARATRDPRLGVVAPQDYTLILSRAAMIPRRAADPGAAAVLLDFLLSDKGRAALSEALLITRPDAEASALDGPGPDAGATRPIALGPPLLVALDAHKRALFLDRWRSAFPVAR